MNQEREIWDEELFAAIERGDMTIVRRMLQRRLDGGADASQPQPLLHLAIELQREDIVEALLMHGADVNERFWDHTPLFRAALRSESLTRLLLAHGADPDLPSGPDAESPFAAAMRRIEKGQDGDGIVQALLEAHAAPNIRDSSGWPVLLSAIWHGANAVAQNLIAHGADIHLAADDGTTALIVASCKGDVAMVRLLLSLGADPNAANAKGDSPVAEAVSHACEEIEKLLLEAGADPLSDDVRAQLRAQASATVSAETVDVFPGDEKERTPLHHAVENGNAALVRALISRGAEVNARDERLQTPLMLAFGSASPEVVRLLLDSGADPMAIDRYKRSTLWHAVYELHLAHIHSTTDRADLRNILQMLLETGIVARDPEGNSWIDDYRTAINLGVLEAVQLFLAHGVDPNITDRGERLALTVIRRRQYDIFLAMAEAGADVSWDSEGDGGTAFSYAARSGNADLVRYFLARGADPNAMDDEDADMSSLGDAVWSGSVETVKLLIDAGADIDTLSKDPRGRRYLSGLYQPIQNANLPMLRTLLDAGVSPGDTLYVAANQGEVEIVRWLLDYGVDINAANASGGTALMGAISKEHRASSFEVTSLLLDRGADVNPIGEQGQTALKYAAGRPEIVRKLLTAGADPNVGYGETALMTAVRAASEESVALLLAAGADVNAVTEDGDTAWRIAEYQDDAALMRLLEAHGAREPEITQRRLHAAILWQKTDDVLRLIREGADVEALNSQQRTPLLAAIEHDCDLRVIEALLTAGADPNRVCACGPLEDSTALAQVVSSRRPDIARLLLARGADPNNPEVSRSPLAIAVSFAIEVGQPENAGLMEIARLLLDADASPNIHDGGEGLTPLIEAARANHLVLMALLLDHGADPDMRAGSEHNLCGRTALAEAVRYGHEEAARLLLSRGAHVDAEDDNGHAPLSYLHIPAKPDDNIVAVREAMGASEQEELKAAIRLAQLLIEHGADVNGADSQGKTLLHEACSSTAFPEERHALIELLLNAGADIHAESEWGETPVSLAGAAGAQTVLELFAARSREKAGDL